MMPGDDVLARVRRAVMARVPLDEREREARTRVLREIDRLPEPFSENADPVHVTGSAIVTGCRGILLHRHKRLGIWLQPGGHLEPGESPWDAARREVREETGLDAIALGLSPAGEHELAHIDVHAGPHGHTHLDLRYLFAGPDAEPAPPPGESPAVRWFGWDEAEVVADVGLVAAIRALRPE